MEKLQELESLLNRLIDDYVKTKEENEKLWARMNEALSKIEKLDKEKRELESLVEMYRSSLNSLVEKLQNMLGAVDYAVEADRQDKT
ncbi:hypothetical protein Theth_0381 [Pseudothermotoga thermarum DSM 5069]|uniref:Uncharacterized protein n=1 Tax=Pseudothermotoga thermarum DSM 5069 TaxID=688269 RepID=F7YVG5_9THEM|nr:hypothetical protein Theth_0381 [Pseudothermotoga thermarum DSM 5069]